MNFTACKYCKHRGQNVTLCFIKCMLPYDVVNCVENYFNNSDYPEKLELDLSNIVERGSYSD